MADLFVEVLLAPGFDADARARFGAKKNLRLIECPLYQPARDAVELRAIDGGFLAQPPDAFADDPADLDLPDEAPADPRGAAGPGVRLAGGALREVERHRGRQRRPDGGDRRRPDEPGGLLPPRRREGAAPGGRHASPPRTPSSPSATAWTCWPRRGSPPWRSRGGASGMTRSSPRRTRRGWRC